MESFAGQTVESGMNYKVYVNPNFKMSVHVNRNFSHHFTNQCQSSKNKIFINPNFIRLPKANDTEVNQLPFNHKERTKEAEIVSKSTSIKNPTDSRNRKVPHLAEPNSRYSLVRHKDKQNEPVLIQPLRQVQTIKVNKYKSVSLNDVKKTLEKTKFDFSKANHAVASKNADSKTMNNLSQYVVPSPAPVSARTDKSRYKITKRNKISLPSVSMNDINRKNNSITQLGHKHSKIKMNRKLFKKNNIPCPLFRKYGKCLRHVQGHCGFLHDKKHVTVCRSFIKGMCHKTECLLSHDLSLQKMPTCYFFLKGMCTRDKCPYLHVKVNEKAKICADFLKGYCEKRDNCMDKHVNMCPNFATKGMCLNKKCSYPHIRAKIDKLKKIKDSVLKEDPKSKDVKMIKENKIEYLRKAYKETVDSRYYKNTMNSPSTNDVCNKIRPIRCKLGTLPSFIEL